jgi:hypothetical protein
MKVISLVQRNRLRLLRSVGMLVAAVDLEFPINRPTEFVVWNHSAHGVFHQ